MSRPQVDEKREFEELPNPERGLARGLSRVAAAASAAGHGRDARMEEGARQALDQTTGTTAGCASCCQSSEREHMRHVLPGRCPYQKCFVNHVT
jgi:hypothetical protein